jgi:hypothetical protein
LNGTLPLSEIGTLSTVFSGRRLTIALRLYEDRLAQLDAEEAMLRQDKPIHPDYLAMLQCVDARRDEKLRVEARLMELRLETLQRSAVGKRSQILAQFYQDVREIRERKLEALGKQWYEIQHDRRGYGSNVEDYAIRFPARKSQQVMHQLAYNTEVSILSGVAKFVGFPAAPPMAAATAAESDLDFEKISVSYHVSLFVRLVLNYPEITCKTTKSKGSTRPTTPRTSRTESCNVNDWFQAC